jgi:FkbM family methyltransferase
LAHQARSFDQLPGPDGARALLAEIATAPCAFAPVATDAPLALYGAGNLGRLARDYLKTVGHDFVAVVDQNAGRLTQNGAWTGVRLVEPQDVTATEKRALRIAVALVTSPYVEVENALRAHGFADIVPFYDIAENFRHLHPLSNGWFAPPLPAQDRDRTAQVLATWDDDVSRAHHLQFLAWRRLREEWTFAPAPMPDSARFFIPEVTRALRGNEILLDAGAHHGGVIRTFMQQTKGTFRQVVAVEPDPASRAELARAFKGDPRIAIKDFAVADRVGEVAFHHGLDYASQISSTGRLRVKTLPIDALDLAPTFVKLHLEGGELAALKGAHRTLSSARPIVAATVYHNADGIWETPHWLMQTLPDYRFLFRVHSWCGTGAVVYAIPNERLTS